MEKFLKHGLTKTKGEKKLAEFSETVKGESDQISCSQIIHVSNHRHTAITIFESRACTKISNEKSDENRPCFHLLSH